MEHQDIAQEIERRIRESLGLTSFDANEDDVPVEIGEPEGEPAGVPAG